MKCARFQGYNTGGVDCGAGVTLDIRDAVTVRIRYKRGTLCQENYPISSNQYMIAFLSTPFSGGYFYTQGAVSPFISLNTTFPVNTWSDLAATYDRNAGANNRKTFRNGVKTNQDTTTGAMNAPVAHPFVGRYHTSSLYMTEGIVAEVQIYNRALSETDIAYLYSHPNNPIRRGCVLNYTQESMFGGTWNDLSGNANHGTFLGTTAPVLHNNVAGRNVSV